MVTGKPGDRPPGVHLTQRSRRSQSFRCRKPTSVSTHLVPNERLCHSSLLALLPSSVTSRSALPPAPSSRLWLRAFALTIFSAWEALSSHTSMAHSLASTRPLVKIASARPSLPTSKVHPLLSHSLSPTLHLWLTFFFFSAYPLLVFVSLINLVYCLLSPLKLKFHENKDFNLSRSLLYL